MATEAEDKPVEVPLDSAPLDRGPELTGDYQVMQGPDIEEFAISDRQSKRYSDFFRKVLGIVSLQVVITACLISVFIFSEDTADWILENYWLPITTFCLGMITLLLPLCVQTLARRVPYNYLNLVFFVTTTQTTCIGITLAALCCLVPVMVVVCAGVGTIYITVAMAVAAWFVLATQVQSKKSIGCSALLIIMLDLALFLGLGFSAALDIGAGYTVRANQIFCAFFSLFYGVYILIDLILILGGNRYGVTSDDYILAAVLVYLDLLRVFLFLLQVLAKAKR